MITFRYHPFREDYVRLNLYILSRKIWAINIISAFSFLSFLTLPFLVSLSYIEGGSLWHEYRSQWQFLVMPGLVATMYGFTYIVAQVRWSAAESLREETEFELGTEGIRTRSAGGDSFSAWSQIEHAEFRSGWYYIKDVYGHYRYFPETCVWEKSELNHLLMKQVSSTSLPYKN